MSDALRLFTKAVYGFDHVMRLVPDNRWNRKSPCDGWTATDVLAHALGGIEAVRLAAEVGEMPKKHSKVGSDPYASFAKTRDAALTALDQPGVLHKVANTFFGPMPVDAFMPMMAADLTVHTWDLARAAKVDERLDPALVKNAVAMFKSFPPEIMRSPGIFGVAVKSIKGADAQTKMLNFAGRTV
jgi:uncharacterized protein (TIGR03086 family)